MGGLYLPDSAFVTPNPAWSLMLMGSVKVVSDVGIFFSVRVAVKPVRQNRIISIRSCDFFFFFCFFDSDTINTGQIPVGILLAAAQDEGEGLSEGGVVSVGGLDDHRLAILCADEDLALHQLGDVVVHVQQPHVDDALGRHFGVVWMEKTGGF